MQIPSAVRTDSGKTFARKVMKHGLLDFVGSDGHRKTERIPEIGKCVAKMEKQWGANM